MSAQRATDDELDDENDEMLAEEAAGVAVETDDGRSRATRKRRRWI